MPFVSRGSSSVPLSLPFSLMGTGYRFDRLLSRSGIWDRLFSAVPSGIIREENILSAAMTDGKRRIMMDPKAMYAVSYGLYILTTRASEQDNGCVTNTVGQVTSDPNRVTVAVNKANHTCGMIQESGVFTASVISQDASFDLFKRFGFQSGRDTDKFAGFDHVRRVGNGTLAVTEGTNAFISAEVLQTIDLGSHTLFISKPVDMDVLADVPSCTYDFYQSSIKPKPQPVAEAPKGETVWRCTICGYEYVGEDLPDDFICPICKHGKADFEKIVR